MNSGFYVFSVLEFQEEEECILESIKCIESCRVYSRILSYQSEYKNTWIGLCFYTYTLYCLEDIYDLTCMHSYTPLYNNTPPQVY